MADGFGFLDDAGRDITERFLEYGPHPSYVAFESVLGSAQWTRSIASIWAFLDDAVTGKGGFADGQYITPFPRESDGVGGETLKLHTRRAVTDYDQFAESVCVAPWDVILQQEDAIRRSSNDKRADEFWMNADRQRNPILDVLEFAFRQARLYLTGWVVIDRPDNIGANAEEESRLKRLPYMYCVRTQNVPRWHLDEDDELDGVVILEPVTGDEPFDRCPFRAWSRGGWATFVRDGKNAALVDSGENLTGVVPVVPLHDHKPIEDDFVDATDMLSVARLAQTVYNQDSEARDVERKAAAFLAMGVKDAKSFDTKPITVGVDRLLIFDGDSGPPAWVSPDLQGLDQLTKSSDRKKAAAYEVANMRAMVGAIETSSGFHALVEFSKSERAVAKRARALENVERRATEIYLRFLGATTEQIEAAEIVISYPRKFGIANVGEIQEQTAKLFATNPGAEVVEEQFKTLLSAMFPRVGSERIAELAAAATAQHMHVREVIVNAMDSRAGSEDRMKRLAAQIDDEGE